VASGWFDRGALYTMDPSFLSAARRIQKWWRQVRPWSAADLRQYMDDYQSWEAGEYEECRHCHGNEAFCDCEEEMWAGYDADDLRKLDRQSLWGYR